MNRRKGRRLIWRYCKRTDEYEAISIRHVAVRRDYCSTPNDDGTLNQTLEPLIADAFDAPASRTARKIMLGEALTVDERSQFAAYVAFLHGRVPLAWDSLFEMMSKVGTFLAYELLKMPADAFIPHARERGFTGTDDEILEMQVKTREQLKQGELTVGPHKAATMLGPTVAVESLAPILFGMNWIVLRPALGGEFIIGDSGGLVASDVENPQARTPRDP